MKVFIYGTLKRGFALHDKGLGNSEYIGDVVTVEPYPLLIAAPFYGPMMLEQPGIGLQVTGELFEVPEDDLPVLDKLEDVGEEGSFRAILKVQASGGGLVHDALVFLKDENWLDPIHSGFLSAYNDRRFIPPWDR